MKIAVTGYIGSGKSTFCKTLQSRFPDHQYISFDEIVAKLYRDPEMQIMLVRMFGTHDKKIISKRMFDSYASVDQTDKINVAALEGIFKNAIKKEFKQILEISNLIFEVPLLFQQGQEYVECFDYIIGVIADEDICKHRAMMRDNKTPSEINTIYKIQSSTDITDKCDWVEDTSDRNVEDTCIDSKLYTELSNIMTHKKKIGIISGSFDPITLGHLWVVKKALSLVDEVTIAVATNPSKKYLMDYWDRSYLIEDSLKEVLTNDEVKRVKVKQIPHDELLVTFAKNINANFIFRGIRNITDFEYESQLNLVNKKIDPDIETIFLLTPRELIEVSSSLIKNSLHLKEWEHVAASYIPVCVLNKLKEMKK